MLGFWYPSVVYNASSVLGSYCMYPFAYAHMSVVKPWYELCHALEKYTDLVRKYQELQRSYNLLNNQYVALQASMSYAYDIEKELTWFKKRFDATAAHVVPVMGIHRSARQHTMLIEGGSNRGLERDMVVLSDTFLVGKITMVYPWYSVVQLITDPASCVSVYGVSSGAHGIVRGTGATDTLLLERVDHLLPIQEKELLLSSGDGLVVPRGYGVGVVENCQSDGLYYSGAVIALHDTAHLKTCLVIERTHLLKIS